MTRYLGVFAAVVCVLALGTGASPGEASHFGPCSFNPPCIDNVSVDTNVTGNTATSVGSIQSCGVLANNDVQDGDETGVDTITVDVAIHAAGVPASHEARAFDYILGYNPQVLSVIDGEQVLYLNANPDSSIIWTGDDTDEEPDTDGSFHAVMFDIGVAPGENGPGVVSRITIEAVGNGFSVLPFPYTDGYAAPGVMSFSFVWADEMNTTREAGNANFGYLVVGGQYTCADGDGDAVPDFADPCPADNDCDNDGEGDDWDNCPFVSDADPRDPDGDGRGNGCDSDDDGDGFDDTIETGCGSIPVDSGSRPERTDGVFAGSDENGDTQLDEPLPVSAAAFDCDRDGFTGAAEAGTPFCGDGLNSDATVFGGADDGVVDDGCPGGPLQTGAWSEAEFSIGTGDQDPCGNDGWPLELYTPTLNLITLQDLTSFIATPRRFGTSPGDTALLDGPDEYNKRWDLLPGGMPDWINLQDFVALIASGSATGKPPMLGGVRAFGGPACPWP